MNDESCVGSTGFMAEVKGSDTTQLSDARTEGPGGDKPRHEHVLASRPLWLWLPTANAHTLAPHPFCVECGLVKALGEPKALSLGSLMNLVSTLDRSGDSQTLRITQAQRRLLAQAVTRAGIDDTFGLTKESQIALLSSLLHQITGANRAVLEEHLRSR